MTTSLSNEAHHTIPPNLFASVMGTGIIANAAVGLPFIGEQLNWFATIIWFIAVSVLLVLSVAFLQQLLFKTEVVKRFLDDPVMAQFFGAPPMAFLTVAGGALLVGGNVFSEPLMLRVAWGLWFLGTGLGLVTAVLIPLRLFTLHEVRSDGAFGGWLMPVVPPMVSAAIGAMLVGRLEAGQLQQTMFYGCYALFGISFFAAIVIITMIWSRLAHMGSSGGARVPTLWIVLGPLGQSITAAGALGSASLLVLEPSAADAYKGLALVFGVPVWGFALFWSMLALLLTIRAIRRKMPVALTWWAFTFPVGTCVTGTTQLAIHSGLIAFQWAALILFAVLIFSWAVAAIGSFHLLQKGQLFLVPVNAPHAVAKKRE